MKKIKSIFLLLTLISVLLAQTDPLIEPLLKSIEQQCAIMDKDFQNYDFLQLEKNTIIDSTQCMDTIWAKLQELQTKHRSRINILHIGDSHLKSGSFSPIICDGLQYTFGDAGKGFGYTLYGKNFEPQKIHKKVKRHSRIKPKSYTVKTTHKVKNGDTLIEIANRYNTTVSALLKMNRGIKRTSVLKLGKTLVVKQKVKARTFVPSANVEPTESDDTNLNDLPPTVDYRSYTNGIYYHSLGINGADYRSYAQKPFFFLFVRNLQPDLVVISLGTNDSMGKFNAKTFMLHFSAFMTRLKEASPNSVVLFTFPPDSYKKARHGKRVENAALPEIRNMLLSYCTKNHYAAWDLYDIMGGASSFSKWYENGLAQKDYVHYTDTGYELQGNLFLQALLKGYLGYVNKPIN